MFNRNPNLRLKFEKISESAKLLWIEVKKVITRMIGEFKESWSKRSRKPLKLTFKKRPRVYKLRGFTTTSRVDKKIKVEYLQRFIRNFLISALVVIVLAILLIIFNPFRDLREIFRMVGI